MTTSPSVRRRHVYFFSGFDPNVPSKYHKLYRDGARKQLDITGARIEVGPRKKLGLSNMGWSVNAQGPGVSEQTVETLYEMVRWDDVVRAHWWSAAWPQLRDYMSTTWFCLHSGVFSKIFHQSKGPFFLVFSPLLLTLAVIPLLLAWLGLAAALTQGFIAAAWGLCGVALASVAWALGVRRHWYSRWVLRSYSFFGRMGAKDVPELEAVIDAAATALVDKVQANDVDEIVLLGHSSGTVLAISVLARALRQCETLGLTSPTISMVTLGHCTPSLSNFPPAQRFRDELKLVSENPQVTWVDYSDPIDNFSFAGADPVTAAGWPQKHAHHPCMLSPHFSELYTPEQYRALKKNKHELHAQYLGGATRAGKYDFFAITSGPFTLAQRVALG